MEKKQDKIYFYIPDFSVRYNLNRTLLTRMKTCPKHFHDGVQIGALYGSFGGAIWNGGRYQNSSIKLEDMREQIDFYANNKIPIRFTWTNPVIRPEHYNDNFCNFIMECAQTGFNEILVNNEGLEIYLRKRYPNYDFLSSTTKRITNLKELDQEFKKKYKLVVLDYDLNNKWDILDQIKEPERCEILVNAACSPNCPVRKLHYKTLGLFQLGESAQMPKPIEDCEVFQRPFEKTKTLPTFVSWDSILNDYVPRGFRHFKIEGRTVPYKNLVDALVYYLVKDKYAEQERAILMTAAAKD